MVVEGSRLVARVEVCIYNIEHVQSISRSQRSTGTLGFYADHEAAEPPRDLSLLLFLRTYTIKVCTLNKYNFLIKLQVTAS